MSRLEGRTEALKGSVITGQTSPPTGESLVKTELLADVTSVAPGTPFRVLIVFTCAPGWHLYWKNPGDSGVPPSVRFELPPGFTVGPLAFPCPTVHVEHGDVTFTHDGTIALVATVSPPTDPTAIPASVRIGASLSWMVCKQICVIGTRGHEINVSASAARGVDPRVKSFLAALPRTNAELGVTAQLDGTTLVVAAPHAQRESLRFIPAATPGVLYGKPESTIVDGRSVLRVPLTLQPQNAIGQAPVAAGAVVVDTKGSPVVFTEISLPLPSSSAPALESRKVH